MRYSAESLLKESYLLNRLYKKAARVMHSKVLFITLVLDYAYIASAINF